MNKIYKLLFFVAFLVKAQETPIHSPTPAPVWEFVRYGNTPINEYKGLVDLNIPLYNVNVDNVSIPLNINYYTGGIRVTEEAGLIGLGWTINQSIPIVIQQIRDKNDYAFNTSFQKLPPFQGSPIIPLSEITENPFASWYGWNTPWNPIFYAHQTLPNISNDLPYFRFVADNKVIDWDGYYNLNFPNDSKYNQMFEPTSAIIDTEPDIFTLYIDGKQIKFCRPQINEQNISSSSLVLKPMVLLDGSGYSIQLIQNSLTYQQTGYNSTINGIEVLCPNGSEYIFTIVEKTSTGGNYTSINYKLSSIKTYTGKEILFNYSSSIGIVEPNKIDARYLRRNGTTQNLTPSGQAAGINLTSQNGNAPSYCGSFNVNDIEKYCSIPLTVGYEYYFLQSIKTPMEQIVFSYSSRLDNASMKKLDNFEVKNIFDRTIKKIGFKYDYFDSFNSTNNFASGGNSSNGGTDWEDDGSSTTTVETSTGYFPLTKRLRLLSVTEDGNNPYVFEYNNTQLPPKNSFSIDYWGFYNGSQNTSFKPNLTHLGYPQYTENLNNDFNSNSEYAKACSLEKIIYPTLGYTVFEFELHQFDDLSYDSLDINYGGGLRIKSITDFNFTNDTISRRSFNYYGGKCINKRVLVKESTEVVSYGSSVISTPVIIATINNFLNQSINSIGDYIGYDRVRIKQEGTTNIGLIEKTFSNNINRCINPNFTYYTNTLNYSYYDNIENGKIITENIYNDLDEIQQTKKYSYLNRFYNAGYGMSKQYSGAKFFDFSNANTVLYDFHPITLATFYPITDKKTFLLNDEITEYFEGNSKTISTNYNYNSSGLLQDKISQDNDAIFQNRNIFTEHTTWNYDLPTIKIKKENNIISEIQKFTYESIANYQRLKKIEFFPKGNTSLPNKKINYDLYDNFNNILQYHSENSINVSIIWGYKNTLPVAKIENIEYNSIPQNLIQNIQHASDNNNESQLQSALDDLRSNDVFKNAMVTTYTHLPMIGVSSITDPKGDKLTYIYDDYGKLLIIKDKEGNIISENKYNYKTQN